MKFNNVFHDCNDNVPNVFSWERIAKKQIYKYTLSECYFLDCNSELSLSFAISVLHSQSDILPEYNITFFTHHASIVSTLIIRNDLFTYLFWIGTMPSLNLCLAKKILILYGNYSTVYCF